MLSFRYLRYCAASGDRPSHAARVSRAGFLWMRVPRLRRHRRSSADGNPKRRRLHLFSIAGRLAEHGRTRRLHLPAQAPWAGLLAAMITRLQTLPAPG
jgi:hypothetical protein